jgi:prolyl-tRNA synthetase
MSKTFEKKGLTKKSENISEWYHDVVIRAGLADYSDVKGSMIIKPDGYAIWEAVQATLDAWFKADGVRNVYFPLFIPYSLINKEKEHMEGFSPELAVVEYAGGEKLAEPLVVRPTSETIMYKTFADWISSWRDLPFKVNQWCNVVRWEKRTYPFLRTSEFLWQEGHTVHKDEADAEEMTLKALAWYQKFYEEYFAIALYVGLKSRGETFAGALRTYATEMVMPDGKALQAATSHNLGDNFAKVFGIEYLNEESEKVQAFQTSWGLSTRSIGGLVLSHGDDSGLVLPPMVAPTQIVIIPITSRDEEAQKQAFAQASKIADELKHEGLRVVVDNDFKSTLGFRINEWELKGVPLRLEIGPKELESGKLKYVRRDNLEKGEISDKKLVMDAQNLLAQIQSDMYAKSLAARNEQTMEAANYTRFKQILDDQKSFVRVLWCESTDCEKKIKEETKATPRVCELKDLNEQADGKCFACGEHADRHWLFAQSY